MADLIVFLLGVVAGVTLVTVPVVILTDLKVHKNGASHGLDLW